MKMLYKTNDETYVCEEDGYLYLDNDMLNAKNHHTCFVSDIEEMKEKYGRMFEKIFDLEVIET